MTSPAMKTATLIILLLLSHKCLSFSDGFGPPPAFPPPKKKANKKKHRRSKHPNGIIKSSRTSSPSFECKRRNVFQKLVSATSIMTFQCLASSCHASHAMVGGDDGDDIDTGAEQRMILQKIPKAPLDALIPAAQQRLLLEQCLNLLTTRKVANETKTDKDVIRMIQSILVKLPSEEDDPKKRRGGGGIRFNNNNKDLSIMLQYQPSTQLSGDIARASMNIYTANLRYGDQPTYAVTDPTWKKSYIRANDGLPDVKKVVEADLDLRDLYRNEVQLKLDDASAELYYLLKNNQADDVDDDHVDLAELQSLLQEAAQAFDQWLDRIDDTDLKDALKAALDGRKAQVYEPYYAGFIPPSP